MGLNSIYVILSKTTQINKKNIHFYLVVLKIISYKLIRISVG